MSYNIIFNEVAKELNIPVEVVNRAYKSYWEFIRKTIQDLPLKDDLTEDDFSKIRTNFNIPSIGKLCCTYDKMLRTKQRFEYIKSLKNAKY
jgi:hypothetical protein